MIRRPPRSPLFPYPPLSGSPESLFPDEPIPGGAIADPEPILLAQLDDPGVSPSPDLASPGEGAKAAGLGAAADRKSTRLNSSHLVISYAVFCLKKKKPATNH